VHEQWIQSVLPAAQTGDLEVVRERPWSLVVKVPTGDGPYWFKENRAGTVYEAGLIAALAQWAPGRVLEPVAVDAARGWSLLPDGGEILRSVEGVDWAPFLSGYAELQRSLSGRSAEMVALGVPDLRDVASCLDALPIPPSVVDYLPKLRGLIAELEASPIPATLQHDDLHDANIFATGKIFDWGDASLAHPFGTLLVTLNVAQRAGHDVERLRDAYLEKWTDLAPRPQLLRLVQVARQVAKVGRALSWQRALIGASAQEIAEWEDPVSGWLEELLAAKDLTLSSAPSAASRESSKAVGSPG
jgi:hypothetical protein